MHKDGPREPTVAIDEDEEDFMANPEDGEGGITLNGTLPVDTNNGVHSLTDVPVFAQGPCQEMFGGVYNNIDIFFRMAECLGLARGKPTEPPQYGYGNGEQ